MPESERSFPDRALKARELHDACAGFTPAYSSPPGGTPLAAFLTKIGVCESLNIDVANAEVPWSDSVQQRMDTAETIKSRTTQLNNYIKSSTTWKTKWPKAKQLANAIRGIKLPRKPLPPPPPGTPPKKRVERGGQSYAELENNWRSLVNLCTGLPGFAPTDVKIQLATLNQLLSTLRGLNQGIPPLEATLSEAQKDRYDAYFEDEIGLAAMFSAVKTTVKGQYGTDSSQWAQIKANVW